MLRLRPYKRCDAEYIACWFEEERAFRKWCADRYDHYPVSAEDINRHYDSYGDSDAFFQFTAFDEQGPAGHLTMRFTDEAKQTVRFGFVVVDSSRRGMGYGKEMLRLAIQYAFEILKARKITLGVFENNPRAYRCYQSVGFEPAVQGEPQYYHVFGEDWKCLEMELENQAGPHTAT